MAKKQRNRRSARKARSQERAEAAATGVSVEEAKQAQVEMASRPKEEESHGLRRPRFVDRICGYFSDVRTELRRVTWPSPRELREYSVCVICALAVIGVAIWLVDTGIAAALVALSGLEA